MNINSSSFFLVGRNGSGKSNFFFGKFNVYLFVDFHNNYDYC